MASEARTHFCFQNRPCIVNNLRADVMPLLRLPCYEFRTAQHLWCDSVLLVALPIRSAGLFPELRNFTQMSEGLFRRRRVRLPVQEFTAHRGSGPEVFPATSRKLCRVRLRNQFPKSLRLPEARGSWIAPFPPGPASVSRAGPA